MSGSALEIGEAERDTDALEVRRVLVLGRPGAGKRTQAAALARHLRLPHVSSGEALRGLALRDSERGELARALLHEGAAFPDEIVVEVVSDALAAIGQNGFVLDGYPRDLRQATALADLIAPHPIDLVFVLEVREDIARSRLRQHGACPSCGRIATPALLGRALYCEACGTIFTPPDGGSALAAARGIPEAREDEMLAVWLGTHARVVHVDANAPPELVAMEIRSQIGLPGDGAPAPAPA